METEDKPASDITEAFASPLPVRIGDQSYTFGDIDVQGFGELRAAIQGQRIAAGNEALASIDPAYKQTAVQEMVRQAMNPPGDLEGQLREFMTTKEGLSFAAALSLRKNHPELKSPDKAWAVVRGMDTMVLFHLLLDRLKLAAAKKSSASEKKETPGQTPTLTT